MRKRSIFWIAIAFAFAINLTACSNSNGNSNKGAEAQYFTPEHSEAEAIYKNGTCISCHAIDLSGHVGEPSNLQKVGAKRSREEIIDTIRNGKGQMPAQRLTDVEIEQLADWLITLK